MKRIVLTLIVLGLVASMPLNAVAKGKKAEVTTAGSIKIAYVDVQRALDSVEDGKKAKLNLQKEFDAKKKKVDHMKAEAEALQKELEKERLILSNEALQAKQMDLQKKLVDIRQTMMQYQQELAQKEAESVNTILKVFENIIKEMGEKEGYTLILEKSQDRLLYAPEKYDLTSALITKYNKRKK